ncbi:MAG: heavy-metal-associated domain-containing protein [Rhizobiaceae bacterium]|jgi:copper chaperone|nr:heavy-metal-associated domain-containing protein [Rhizobiaceae bacterium]
MAGTAVTLSIPDMTCGHCKASVEKAIASVDPDALVSVDLSNRTAEIESAAPLAAIRQALEAKGYTSEPAG